MASQARIIAARVIAVIRAIDGTGDYTYDLTNSTDQVEYGDVPVSSLPCVTFAGFSLVSDDARTLTKYGHELVVEGTGFTGGDGDALGERALNALDLISDIHLAISRDRVAIGAGTLNALTTKAAVGPSTAFDGAGTQLGDYGVGAFRITLAYQNKGGI